MKRTKFSLLSLIYLIPALLLVVFLIGGCTSGSTTSGETVDDPPVNKTWTYMVYMAADNNLEASAWLDMLEMENVGTSDQVNIVVLMDRGGTFYGKKGCFKYLVAQKPHSLESGGSVTAIYSDTEALLAELATFASTPVEEMGNVNTGDPDTLINFVNWGMEAYPANKYAVVLWNHGSGWKPELETTPPCPQLKDSKGRGICWDDTSGDYLTSHEVKYAFDKIFETTGQKIEFVGMDACLMGMVETAYDLKDTVKWFSASENSEPGFGWPYHYILADVKLDPSIDGRRMACTTVSRFKQWYADANVPDSTGINSRVTMSGVNMVNVNALADSISAFAEDAINKMDTEAVNLLAAGESTPNAEFVTDTASYTDYKDLNILFENYANTVTDATLATNATAVNTAVTQAVSYYGYGSSVPTNSRAISIWLPDSTQYGLYQSSYEAISFAQGTQWDEYLELLVIQ